MASMVWLSGEQVATKRGFTLRRERYACVGLTPNGANTVPFPNRLPRAPRGVVLNPMGNGALGVIVSLDDSQGVAAPAASFGGGFMGFDATNVYVYIGNGTECGLTVEY